jgi:hypothetical protein
MNMSKTLQLAATRDAKDILSAEKKQKFFP